MSKKFKPRKNDEPDDSNVDLADVERVLAFMQKHGLEELAYERSGVHIHLRKASSHPAGGYSPVSAADMAAAASPASGQATAPSASSAGSKERAADPAPASDIHVIKSPIVGTYYAAAGPTADPFVAVGDKVESGQVLCIIEAMKLMNEIESDLAGEVVQILVENGHPVEYGQPLFGIRAKSKK
jgi:acetyl-CoA carboxylase biotin carboxyl carrier protein